jgi:tRNA A-37 threonylcarbamoyl transferase component Bud32
LQKVKFATFNEIWDFPIQWIDTPNQNRGGWSGVGCLEITFEHEPVTLFVKKQFNHTTRTIRHPIEGESTFAREYKAICFLQSHGLLAPNVVFFGQRVVNEGQQAILVTEMLADYHSLDEVQRSKLSLLQKRQLLRDVAKTIRRLHQIGIQHRAMYAKHIFVKPCENSFEVAFIDLEKSRRMVFPYLQAMTDLITLNYRTKGWSKSSRLYFYMHYLGQRNLSPWNIILCRYIKAKSARKSY